MKKILLSLFMSLVILNVNSQNFPAPVSCDSIDITLNTPSSYSQLLFSSNWILNTPLNNGTLSPYFATFSSTGILIAEDSSFQHTVLNFGTSAYDTLVTCFTVEGLDSLPNTPLGTLTWSCGVDMNGNLIYCNTYGWDGSNWNFISPQSPPATWNCGPNIGCWDPADGTGTYSDYTDCDTSCGSGNWNWNNFTICDSLEVLIISSTADSVTLGTNLSTLPYSGQSSYDWALVSSNGFSTVSTLSTPTFSVNPLDTSLYFLNLQLVDSSGMTWNCMYPVIIFWDNSQWIALRTSMPTSIDEIGDINKELVKVVDLLGRESEIIKNKVLLYIYSDGSVDKKIVR
jgi:hypothetical protein